MLQSADKSENAGYATQKPEALLSRIVSACSNEGDLIVDFFCGSGGHSHAARGQPGRSEQAYLAAGGGLLEHSVLIGELAE